LAGLDPATHVLSVRPATQAQDADMRVEPAQEDFELFYAQGHTPWLGPKFSLDSPALSRE
jgi:hypothetical protein